MYDFRFLKLQYKGNPSLFYLFLGQWSVENVRDAECDALDVTDNYNWDKWYTNDIAEGRTAVCEDTTTTMTTTTTSPGFKILSDLLTFMPIFEIPLSYISRI